MKENILDLECQPNEVALNPSLLADGDNYLLAVRHDALDWAYVGAYREVPMRQFWGTSHVTVEEMDAALKPTGRRITLEEGQDPRLFRAMGKLWLAYTTLPRMWRQWVVGVSMAHHFEAFGSPMLPCYEDNTRIIGPHHKNWTWINGAGSLDCVFRWEPFTALRFDQDGCCIEKHSDNTVILPWRYGVVHGGTPSVLLPSGERFSIFHSHLDDPRRYYMGGVYHAPEWPYRPIKTLQRPLMIGTRRFVRWPNLLTGERREVVFPCGLVAKHDRLLVSYGVDDCACAVAEFSYEELKDYDTGA